MRRRDNRHAAGHRLDDRHPEALEARGVDDDRRAAVEPRQLLVGDEAEPDDVRAGEERLLAPARAARRREEQLFAEQPMGLRERLEVLPRLERRDRQHVGPAELGALAVRPELRLQAGPRDANPLGRDAEPLDDVARPCSRS